MPTEENKVKRKIREVLNKFHPDLYDFMPVQFGYGMKTLDYLMCMKGRFVAIEAKAPGKEPTPLQEESIRQIRAAGGKVFVIDGTPDTDTCADLFNYLNILSRVTSESKETYNPAWTHGE